MEETNDIFEAIASINEKLWIKNYDKGVKRHLPQPDTTLKDVLQHWVEVQPDKPHIIFKDHILTYKESNALACKLANSLLNLGCNKHDRISIILPNSPEIIISFMACYKTGMIAAAYNPRSTETEIKKNVMDNGAVAILVTAEYAEKAINIMREGTTSVRHVIVVNSIYDSKSEVDGVLDFYQLINKEVPTEPNIDVSPDDLQILLYTGGTTGLSKGCCVTNRAIIGHDNAFINWYLPALGDADWRILMCLPFTHALAINMGINWCLVAGGTVVVLETPTTDAIIETMNKHKPTIWVAVPALINQIVYHPRIEKSQICALRLVLVGSAPVPVETFATFKKYTNAFVIEGFGMTEAICAVTFNPTNKAKLGSIGIPFIGTDVLIVDTIYGNTVMPPNRRGEIIYRGPQTIKEYWNKPEETAYALRNGWMYSGDIGYMDEDGYFYIVDRKKDMINVGGFNVYPREIDELLYKHPKIYASCTVGAPEQRLGEVVLSFIVVKPNEKLDSEEVISYCREHLTAYKVPKYIVYVKDIPLTKANKPDKVFLKKEAHELISGKVDERNMA